MTKKYKYSKEGMSFAMPLFYQNEHYKKMRNQWWEEVGLPRDPNKKFNEDIIYEISCAFRTLSSVFDNNHPDHTEYDDLNLEPNHLVLWNKIEHDLECLIDNVKDYNTLKYEG